MDKAKVDRMLGALVNFEASADYEINYNSIVKRFNAWTKWGPHVDMYEQPDGGFAGMTFEEFITAMGLSITPEELELVSEIIRDRAEQF